MEHITTVNNRRQKGSLTTIVQKVVICSSIFILTLFSNKLIADPCKVPTKGREFWFGFMEGRHYHPDHRLEITVTADETTTFQITVGRNQKPIGDIYTVNAHQATRIIVPWEEVEPITSEEVEDKGIHLTSEKPVSVYALNWSINSADAAVIYPVTSLGNEYFAICYYPDVDNNPEFSNGRNSEFLIVATQDNTNVVITPSKITDKERPANEPFTITLHKGELFQVQSENEAGLKGQGDLTGSHVLSDKPIAFFSGSLSTRIPNSVCCWDHLYEQIPPVHLWGKEFYPVPLKSREQDRYRILAAYDNTTVTISETKQETLNRGEFYEFISYFDQSKEIITDKPVLVAQYSQSQEVDFQYTGGNGDPFMMIVSPANQSINEISFVAYRSPDLISSIDYSGITKHYVNITTRGADTANIRLNGEELTGSFHPFPGDNFFYTQIEIDEGTHHLKNISNQGGFQAYVYGFGGVESYGYNTGSGFDLSLERGFLSDTLIFCHSGTLKLVWGPWFDNFNWSTGETTPEIDITESGTYYVEASTKEGCILSDTVYVIVSSPSISLGDDITACPPYTAELKIEDEYPAYLWQNSEGDTLSVNPVYKTNISGDYYLTVTDSCGCSAIDKINLKIFTVPYIKIDAPQRVCESDHTTLTLSVIDNKELLPPDPKFIWGTIPESQLNFLDDKQNSVKMQINENNWGSYKIFCETTTIDDCIISDTVTITFYKENPRFDFKIDPVEGCQPLKTKITPIPEDDDDIAVNWYSQLTAGSKSSFQIERERGQSIYTPFDIILKEAGVYNIKASVTSLETGCEIEVNQAVEVWAKPSASFYADYPITYIDNSTVSFTNTSRDAVEYHWNFDDGKISLELNPSHEYLTNGEYWVKLIATAENSCIDTAQAKIMVLPANINFPNAFRPESSIEENRTFMPIKEGVGEGKFNLKIFNRSGYRVFESNLPEDPWDGRLPDGKEAPPGNYIWHLRYHDLQGKSREHKGEVLLIR